VHQFSCSDQVGACANNESVYLDRMTSSLDRSHYPSLLTTSRYYGDDYTRMKWPASDAAARCRMHFNNHFLQTSSVLDLQYPGTTNVAGEGPEMPCCDGRPPSLLADVTSAGSGTMVVAAGGYPTVCLYDDRSPSESASFNV